MFTAAGEVDGTLRDLRYASVDGPPGRRDRRAAPDPAAARTPPAVCRRAGRGAVLALAGLLAGCSRGAEPDTFAVPDAAAARIRMVCPPGTFIGTMTANCPQPAARPAPAQ